MAASVLFLRGVNVGGHKAFKPSELAKKLAHLDCTSIGAAGTFVICKNISKATLREEVLERLPFAPQMMICRATEVIDLFESDPFHRCAADKGVTCYVSVMAKSPPATLRLPYSQPDGNRWQVKIISITGKFVLSLHRRSGKRLIYPNEVVEKLFGGPATTRNWNTVEMIVQKLRGQ